MNKGIRGIDSALKIGVREHGTHVIFSANGISAGYSGTGSTISTKGTGERTNGETIFREDGHIRLGIAKHDGIFMLVTMVILTEVFHQKVLHILVLMTILTQILKLMIHVYNSRQTRI